LKLANRLPQIAPGIWRRPKTLGLPENAVKKPIQISDPPRYFTKPMRIDPADSAPNAHANELSVFAMRKLFRFCRRLGDCDIGGNLQF
jgi:hypothetical protein